MIIYFVRGSVIHGNKALEESTGTLVVQWLRLRDPNARGAGWIPSQGTRFHRPQQ